MEHTLTVAMGAWASADKSSHGDVPQWAHDLYENVVQFCHTNPIAAGLVGLVVAGIAIMVLFAILLDF